jgi:hypothetical protein
MPPSLGKGANSSTKIYISKSRACQPFSTRPLKKDEPSFDNTPACPRQGFQKTMAEISGPSRNLLTIA